MSSNKDTKNIKSTAKVEKEAPKVQKEAPKVQKEVAKVEKEVPKVQKEAPKVEKVDNEPEDELTKLLIKYDNLIEHLDYRNMLYYAALFKQLFKDFKLDDEEGKIDKSIDDLAKLLEKACDKLQFDIRNASVKQLIKLYGILIEKIGGTKSIRDYDPDVMEPLLFRMYTDGELFSILEDLEEKKINPDHIIGINNLEQIVFSKGGKTYQLESSRKIDELIDFYAEMNKE